MSDDQSTGDSDTSGRATNDENDERWIAGPDVLEARLPIDLAAALGRILGREPIDTLGEWTVAVRQFSAGAIRIDDLCHQAEETNHWGELHGERHHFACFYDAVILAALAEEPVDVHTESPGGELIEAHAAGSAALTVTPSSAVFSFGIAEGIGTPEDREPTHADVYGAVCPYVRAFPDRVHYLRWAERVPASTVAMSLAGATDLADALVS